MSEQWELPIVGPLAMTKSELPQFPLLLVIDALDKCDDERDVLKYRQLGRADSECNYYMKCISYSCGYLHFFNM